MKKKEKLSDKHEAFCQELVKDWNETQAYHRAYNNKNMDTCRNNASRLLANASVLARVRELKEQRNQESMIDIKYVIDKAKFVVETDFTELMALGKKGATREEFDELPREIRSLIQSVKITTRRDRDGSDVENIQFTLMSKDKAIEILGKHTGAYSDGITNVNVGFVSVTDKLKNVLDKADKRNKK